MDFYFVYSSGGGGGDWNGIDRIWEKEAPIHFKDNLLIKFGDIFFNHKGLKSVIKPQNWKNITSARDWIYNNTKDKYIYDSKNLILDVGTTKIVSYINANYPHYTPEQIIVEFDKIIADSLILEKYAKFIVASDIKNAITFDIPNPFKIRNSQGVSKRNIFFENSVKTQLRDKCIEYANKTYQLLGNNSDRLLTIIPAFLDEAEIKGYLSDLEHVPKKIAIGALIDLNNSDFRNTLIRLNKALNFNEYEKVHLLGCGGIKKVQIIKQVLGNMQNISVDNTTAYNRSIDGNIKGTAFSKYYDYSSKKMTHIKKDNIKTIKDLHSKAPNKKYTDEEMHLILEAVLIHQDGKSPSPEYSYDNRARLIIHNFDVYKQNAD